MISTVSSPATYRPRIPPLSKRAGCRRATSARSPCPAPAAWCSGPAASRSACATHRRSACSTDRSSCAPARAGAPSATGIAASRASASTSYPRAHRAAMKNAPHRGAFPLSAADARGVRRDVRAYLTMMSLRTPWTPLVSRARRSAIMRSSGDLAKPDSCTTPFIVSTLMAIALLPASSSGSSSISVVDLELAAFGELGAQDLERGLQARGCSATTAAGPR